MKKINSLILIAVILLLWRNNSAAQTYLDFPPQGNQITWLYHFQNPNHNGTYQYRYSSEDTIINGFNYKTILFSYYDFVVMGLGVSYVDEGYDLFSSYLRQDTDGVIYVKFSAAEEDKILFDLSLQAGDTVPPTWLLADFSNITWYNNPVTISGIDTLYDNQNAAHRVYHFDTPDFLNREFIEGIGCTYDFYSLIPSGVGAPLSTIACVSSDGTQLYPFTGSVNCTPLVNPDGVDDMTSTAKNIGIFPNPTCGNIAISELSEKATATIMDATGRVVLTTEVINNNVDVALLANGVYVLRIETAKGVSNFRAIKQ